MTEMIEQNEEAQEAQEDGKLTVSGKGYSCSKVIPADFAGLVTAFGESAVAHYATRGLQSSLRNVLYSATHKKTKDGTPLPVPSEAELQAIADNWDPSTAYQSERKPKAKLTLQEMLAQEMAAALGADATQEQKLSWLTARLQSLQSLIS